MNTWLNALKRTENSLKNAVKVRMGETTIKKKTNPRKN